MIDYILGKLRSRFTSAARRSYYGYGGYGDREDYYQNLFSERSAESLTQLLTLKEEAIANARIQLTFRNIRFGATPKDAQKRLGKPRFTVKNPQLAHHEVLFYRFKIQHLHSVAALHFLEDKFFFAAHTFRHLDTGDYRRVLRVLGDKYGLLPPPEDTAIKDRDDNVVTVTDGLYFTVRYLAGHPHFLERIAQLSTERAQYLKRLEAQRLSSINDFL